MSVVSARSKDSHQAGKARFQRRGNKSGQSSADHSMASGSVTMLNSKMRTSPKRSLNHVISSPQNVERLLHEACVKTKEAYVLKKMGSQELPEHLQGSNLPVEALALEKDLLI